MVEKPGRHLLIQVIKSVSYIYICTHTCTCREKIQQMVLVEECGKGYMGVLYCFCNFSLFKQISKEKDLKKKKIQSDGI